MNLKPLAAAAAAAVLAACSGPAVVDAEGLDLPDFAARIGTECQPEDYLADAIVPECFQGLVTATFMPDGAVINRSDVWVAADPYFTAAGAFDTYGVDTAAEVVAYELADQSPGDYASFLEQQVTDDSTVGDYIEAEDLMFSMYLDGGVLTISRGTLVLDLAQGSPLQQWATQLSVDGDEVTLTATIPEPDQSDAITVAWLLPGEIVDTNGEVQGDGVVFTLDGMDEMHATFTGLDASVLDALSALTTG